MAAIKGQKYIKPFFLLVLPLAIVIAYLFGFAIEKYRSESKYVICDLSTKENFGLDLGIFSTAVSSRKQDASIVMEYLRSLDLLNKLDQRFHLRDRYRSVETDILDRLYSFSTDEDFLELYRKNLKIVYDELSGITSIAYDISAPQLSKNILEFLLQEGEAFSNRLNRQRAEKKIAFAASQLTMNKRKLDRSIMQVEDFQDRHMLVDPSADVAVQNNIIGNLEALIVEKTAEKNQLLSYMVPDAIEIQHLKKEIHELKSALSKSKARLSGAPKERLNDLLFDYQILKNEMDFATEVYKKTLVQYEVSKIEAMQESKLFEVIAVPNMPDGHVYPQRIKIIATAIVLIGLFYKIVSLVWAVIQDHKD